MRTSRRSRFASQVFAPPSQPAGTNNVACRRFACKTGKASSRASRYPSSKVIDARSYDSLRPRLCRASINGTTRRRLVRATNCRSSASTVTPSTPPIPWYITTSGPRFGSHAGRPNVETAKASQSPPLIRRPRMPHERSLQQHQHQNGTGVGGL